MTQNSKTSLTRSRRLITLLVALAMVLTCLPLTAFAAVSATESDPIAMAQNYLSQYDDNYVLNRNDLNAIVAILNGEQPVSASRARMLVATDPTQQEAVASFLTEVAGMKESQFAGGPDDDMYFNYNEMARSAGFFDNWDYDPTALLTGQDTMDMIRAMNDAIYGLRNAINAKNPEPYFVNGMAVPIFEYGDSNYYDESGDGIARFVVYVETDLDTDGDGQLDLVQVLVQLPRAAVDKGMKVSTIFEARPYIAGTNSQQVPSAVQTAGNNWLATNGPFDHEELYATPPARIKAGETDTKTMVENGDYNDWYYTYNREQVYEDLNWYDYYLVRGFAVVESAGIGSYGSEGFANCGADIEINAFRCVIEWLTGDRVAYSDKTGNIAIEADWSNGNVGMTGRSYAGTTQFGLSTTGVKGLKTIVPVAGIASWYEYTNGQGRLGSTAYTVGLAWYVNSRYLSSSWDSILDRYAGYSQQMRADETALNGDYGDHWARRDYTVENWFRDWGPSKIQTPMLIVHGLNDDNVRAKQSNLMYQAAQKAGVPVKMMLHQGHHMTPTYPASTYEMYCGTYNINGQDIDLMYDDILNLWFSHYLYGIDNDVMDILPNLIVQSNDIEPEGNGSNAWVHYDSWEPGRITVLNNNFRVQETEASFRTFSATAFEEPEDYSEEYPIPNASPDTNENELDQAETEATIAAAASSIDEQFITINSANGSSSWQNFLNGPTAGSSLYVTEFSEDTTVKGVVAVKVRAAFETLGSNAAENLSMHVKLVEVAQPGTTLRFYGGNAVGSSIGTTTLMSKGAWMGGGVTNYNLVRFNQATTGTYREIAKGWIDLCNPSAGYDSYTASREDRINPSENIGVYHDYTVYMQPAVHTVKAGNTLALIITTGNTSAAAYTGNNAFTFTIDNEATYAEIPLDDPNGLRLSTDAHRVRRGDYANITTEFVEPIESNTAILNYTFDTELFEFADFHEESGVTVISQEATEDGAKVVVMVPSYNTQTYGKLAIRAKDDALLTTGRETVKVYAEYVVRDADGNKEIRYDIATTSFTTIDYNLIEGDTNGDGIVDLVDLSNMIDWFGLDSSDPEWDDWYTYFDFNDNNEIDISDIVYVARLIK